jgi:hypothetical protein
MIDVLRRQNSVKGDAISNSELAHDFLTRSA